MITKSLKPIILGIFAFSLLLVIAQFFRDELAFHRLTIDTGNWWLILSGNFVHSNYSHLFLNIAGLWVFTFIFYSDLTLKTLIISILILAISVGLGLYLFDLKIATYYGLSGVLYGLFLVGATKTILQKDWLTGVVVAFFIIGKIAWDLIYGSSSASAELIGVPVAVHAHLYGAIGAFFISIGLYLAHSKEK